MYWRGWTSFVAGIRRLRAVEFGGEREVGTGNVLYLFAEGAHFRRAYSGFSFLKAPVMGRKSHLSSGGASAGGGLVRRRLVAAAR